MLENLRTLRKDMINKGWTICSFIFMYRGMEYIVLVKIFVDKEKKVSQYALVKLHFMKSKKLNDELQVEANSKGLIIDAKELREYFGIPYKEDVGDIIKSFTKCLGSAIPSIMPDIFSDKEKDAMVKSLSNSDSEDPNKIYCTGVKRNPEGNKRSKFNEDKTKLLRSILYEYFRNDTSISFCYSTHSIKERDDATILSNFANNC